MPAIEAAALDRLVAYADGDARRLLNTLETLAVAADAGKAAPRSPTPGCCKVLGERMRRYDKGGEQFYDTISALHKSVRGSDPDAALYWFVRMLDGGADPRYMARRMIRMASEDIGLADPRALRLALDAAEVYERLGTPEGELALAECVVYLAMAPKSNAVYKAYNEAKALVKQGRHPAGAACTCATRRRKLMKDLDYGKGYRYAHDEEGGFAAGETYFPEGMDAAAVLPAGGARPGDPHRREAARAARASNRERRSGTQPPDGRAGNPGKRAPVQAPARGYNPADNPPTDLHGGFFARWRTASHERGATAPRDAAQETENLYGNPAAADHQRSGPGQHVRPGGPGLHHGVRHHQPDQFRPRRGADGRRAHQLGDHRHCMQEAMPGMPGWLHAAASR